MVSSFAWAESASAGNGRATLSAEERKWLDEQDGAIRIGITVIPPQVLPGEKPGEYKGLAIDYIRLEERKLGCRFRLIAYPTWNEVLVAAQAKEIDVIFAAQQTPDRDAYLLFSRPYMELPNIIVTRQDREGGSSLEGMKGWKIAVSQGSAVEEYLKSQYGFLTLAPVRDELSGLRDVSTGEADAMVVEISRASYYIETAGILNLRVSGNTDLLYRLRFATRKDWPMLNSILDKGLSAITPEERREIRRQWIIVSANGRVFSRVFWISLGAGLLVVGTGIVGVVMWNRTLRRLVHQRTAQLQQELAERKKAEEALVAAKDAAETASKTKDHFLAVLSHELRNPLNPVLATASLLRDDPRYDADTREQLEMICRNAEMEARLIDDLLDMTRIERGKIELNRECIELGIVVRRAIEVCRPEIEARHLAFTADLGPGPYWVYADAARLQQVFWNLLKNAIKFTLIGGSVSIRCCQEDEGRVLVEVKDTGVGIEAEAIGRIFNAFEQADRSLIRRFGGLGLGLTISRTLVEMHGGSIEAASAGKGQGATFRVRLPRMPEGPAPVTAFPQGVRPDEQPGSDRAMRILLVEDHGDTVRIMRRLLAAKGHQVEVAGDVASGLRLAADGTFDLLLSDLGLPDGSGLDLMRTLRSAGSRLPGIAISGYGQEQDVQRSLDAGFRTHLAKPVSVAQLMAAIARIAGEQGTAGAEGPGDSHRLRDVS